MTPTGTTNRAQPHLNNWTHVRIVYIAKVLNQRCRLTAAIYADDGGGEDGTGTDISVST